MGNSIPRVSIPKDEEVDLTARQLSILTDRFLGPKRKRVSEIAQNLGCSTKTVERETKRIKESGWKERQVARIKAAEKLMFANWLTNVEGGNLDAVIKVWQRLDVLPDKIQLSGTIEQKLSDKELRDVAKEAVVQVIQEIRQSGAKKIEDKSQSVEVKEAESKSL